MTSTDLPPVDAGKRRRPRRIWRRVIIGVGVVALIVGIGGAAAYWKLNANIDSTDIGTSLVKDETPKGALNILFIGSDSRDLATDEYGNDKSARSDALMLVHFSKDNTRIDAVQIPRDTLIDLPACEDTGSGAFAGGEDLINSALAGGPACSVRAVEQLSNVRIDHFVQLDFDGFASMVNALGGVDVCLNEPMVDADAKLDLPAGKQKLEGKDALALARTRKAVGDGSDIGRLGHQQVVMSSIISRARSAGVLTRPDRLFKFLNALTSSITVDKGIDSITSLTGLAQRARSVSDEDIRFITMPNGAAPSDPNRVVPSADAPVVFAAVANDQQVPLEDDGDDDRVRTATIRILNAARTSGLATEAQSSLIERGYVVSELADAENASDVTRIFIDGSDESRATAESLNKDFKLEAEIVDQGSKMTGVWLILGADRAEEGTSALGSDPVEATSRTAADDLCT